jgi:small nuclear ribonucleoprotein (snRNP)-like protein
MACSAGLVLASLTLASIVLLATGAEAKVTVVPIEGMSYNVDATIADNLKSLVGKKVYVTLDSGSTLSGRIKAVGNHLLHLEKLDGKEYFDALIRIERISAIDTKFRDIQR